MKAGGGDEEEIVSIILDVGRAILVNRDCRKLVEVSFVRPYFIEE